MMKFLSVIAIVTFFALFIRFKGEHIFNFNPAPEYLSFKELDDLDIPEDELVAASGKGAGRAVVKDRRGNEITLIVDPEKGFALAPPEEEPEPRSPWLDLPWKKIALAGLLAAFAILSLALLLLPRPSRDRPDLD